MKMNYKGHSLDIKDTLIQDFDKYNAHEFCSIDIDGFIYNKYIGDKNRENEVDSIVKELKDDENEVDSIVKELKDDEIVIVIEDSLIRMMRYYTQDPHYGELT